MIQTRLYKKAISDYYLMKLIFAVAFTVAGCFAVVMIVQSGYGNVYYGSREMDAMIAANTLLHSPILTNYDAKMERYIGASINETKFDKQQETEAELESFFSTGDVKYMAMKITLQSGNAQKSLYYHKADYDSWKTYYLGGFKKGAGSYVNKNIKYAVTVGERSALGYLIVDVYIPNG